eukprot:3100476-Rhodomonas_salina.2
MKGREEEGEGGEKRARPAHRNMQTEGGRGSREATASTGAIRAAEDSVSNKDTPQSAQLR